MMEVMQWEALERLEAHSEPKDYIIQPLGFTHKKAVGFEYFVEPDYGLMARSPFF